MKNKEDTAYLVRQFCDLAPSMITSVYQDERKPELRLANMNFVRRSTDALMTVLDFAIEKHRGQVRKYTKEPYINHCLRVALILIETVKDEFLNSSTQKNYESDSLCDLVMLSAALLHDTIEDTQTTFDDICKLEIGEAEAYKVANIVVGCSNVYSNPRMKELVPRDIRKQMEDDRIAACESAVINIKLADMLDNTDGLSKHDLSFAEVYLKEKLRLLSLVEKKADERLFNHTYSVLNGYMIEVKDLKRASDKKAN